MDELIEAVEQEWDFEDITDYDFWESAWSYVEPSRPEILEDWTLSIADAAYYRMDFPDEYRSAFREVVAKAFVIGRLDKETRVDVVLFLTGVIFYYSAGYDRDTLRAAIKKIYNEIKRASKYYISAKPEYLEEMLYLYSEYRRGKINRAQLVQLLSELAQKQHRLYGLSRRSIEFSAYGLARISEEYKELYKAAREAVRL